jgi:hypothetical protein
MKFEPCPEAHMEVEALWWTACEYLRVVYYHIKSSDMDEKVKNECMEMLRTATSIAKHLSYKVAEYEPIYKKLEIIYDPKEVCHGYL